MLEIESYKRGIAFSIIFNVPGKGLTLLVIIIIAYYFGSTLGKETGKKINAILPLRLHPSIIALREKIRNSPKNFKENLI